MSASLPDKACAFIVQPEGFEIVSSYMDGPYEYETASGVGLTGDGISAQWEEYASDPLNVNVLITRGGLPHGACGSGEPARFLALPDLAGGAYEWREPYAPISVATPSAIGFHSSYDGPIVAGGTLYYVASTGPYRINAGDINGGVGSQILVQGNNPHFGATATDAGDWFVYWDDLGELIAERPDGQKVTLRPGFTAPTYTTSGRCAIGVSGDSVLVLASVMDGGSQPFLVEYRSIDGGYSFSEGEVWPVQSRLPTIHAHPEGGFLIGWTDQLDVRQLSRDAAAGIVSIRGRDIETPGQVEVVLSDGVIYSWGIDGDTLSMWTSSDDGRTWSTAIESKDEAGVTRLVDAAIVNGAGIYVVGVVDHNASKLFAVMHMGGWLPTSVPIARRTTEWWGWWNSTVPSDWTNFGAQYTPFIQPTRPGLLLKATAGGHDGYRVPWVGNGGDTVVVTGRVSWDTASTTSGPLVWIQHSSDNWHLKLVFKSNQTITYTTGSTTKNRSHSLSGNEDIDLIVICDGSVARIFGSKDHGQTWTELLAVNVLTGGFSGTGVVFGAAADSDGSPSWVAWESLTVHSDASEVINRALSIYPVEVGHLSIQARPEIFPNGGLYRLDSKPVLDALEVSRGLHELGPTDFHALVKWPAGGELRAMVIDGPWNDVNIDGAEPHVPIARDCLSAGRIVEPDGTPVPGYCPENYYKGWRVRVGAGFATVVSSSAGEWDPNADQVSRLTLDTALSGSSIDLWPDKGVVIWASDSETEELGVSPAPGGELRRILIGELRVMPDARDWGWSREKAPGTSLTEYGDGKAVVERLHRMREEITVSWSQKGVHETTLDDSPITLMVDGKAVAAAGSTVRDLDAVYTTVGGNEHLLGWLEDVPRTIGSQPVIIYDAGLIARIISTLRVEHVQDGVRGGGSYRIAAMTLREEV